jgi:hypothetical protein
VWEAGISGGGKRHCLGSFHDPRQAALAYDRAAQERHAAGGCTPVLNFPPMAFSLQFEEWVSKSPTATPTPKAVSKASPAVVSFSPKASPR